MSQQLNLENKNERKELSIKIKNNINKFTEKLQRHSNRLPASLMGETCLRKLWYVFRWVKLEHFDGRMQRLFDVGNYAEPRFINYLEGIGFKVWPVDPQTNEQWSIKALNGHYGGKSDGKAEYCGYKFQLEFKTNCTGSGYANVEKQGLEKSKPKHWSQINIYGYYEKLQYGLYLIENKNDSDITIEIVKLDWALGQALEAKAWEIINSRTPPARISNEPSYFDCKFCSFREICHYKAKVEHNCRSCRYSVPTKDASWTCDKFGLIPPEFVKIGCNQHISINGE